MPHLVHLIDASPYIFRAYFSMPSEMEGPLGQPVGAVYGFASFLVKYIADEQPTHLGVAFDESLTTSFRNELYPEYKAQRELPPESLVAQLQDCRAVCAALGAAEFADERYEADDLIGALAEQVLALGHHALIVTSDKDLSQLVRPGVEMFNYAKAERFGAEGVRAKMGVEPEQVPDFLGLAGDSVDNIPGVRGVGPKTASALLAEFTDLEEVYADLERVAELPIRGAKSLAKKLAEHRELAFLSRKLATIACDAPAKADLGELELVGADPDAIDPLFERLGFEGLRSRITRWR